MATGGVFTGRLAEANGLIDEIGGEPEAIDWLESRDPALEGLDVVDWEVTREEPRRWNSRRNSGPDHGNDRNFQ